MRGYKELHWPTLVVENACGGESVVRWPISSVLLSTNFCAILLQCCTKKHSTVTVSPPAFFFANVEHQLNPHINGEYLQGQICLISLPFEIVLQ